jgi:uncharacterized membrane protein
MKHFFTAKFIRKIIDETFEVGVLLKLIFGFLETVAGIILAFSGKLMINNFIINLAQQEVSEDPKDIFVNYLLKVSSNFFSDVHMFAIVYLIFHGVVNIFLGYFLLKEKIWAYPTAICLFFPFLVYQVYRYFHTHSLLLIFLSIFDACVMWVIYLEYQKKLARLNKK